MICSICMLSVHAVISAIYVYFDSRKHHTQHAALQFFNALIFLEVYNSLYGGNPVEELNEIRLLETVIESAPQALLQIYFVMEYAPSDWTSDPAL